MKIIYSLLMFHSLMPFALSEDRKIDNPEVVWMKRIPGSVEYFIDKKARLCFIKSPSDNFLEVDCQKLKKGYSELKDVITWD